MKKIETFATYRFAKMVVKHHIVDFFECRFDSMWIEVEHQFPFFSKLTSQCHIHKKYIQHVKQRAQGY